jgi:hypothetical protein
VHERGLPAFRDARHRNTACSKKEVGPALESHVQQVLDGLLDQPDFVANHAVIVFSVTGKPERLAKT